MKFMTMLVVCAFSIPVVLAQDSLSVGTNPEPAPVSATVRDSSSKPDAPIPITDQVNSTCPDGRGKLCALLAGRLYLGPSTLAQHDKTTWQALKNPYVAAVSAALVASTVLDIEGTKACVRAHTCREGNPLFGSHLSRARAYEISMPINALGIWAMARNKRNGGGVETVVTGTVISLIHTYFGLSGLASRR